MSSASTPITRWARSWTSRRGKNKITRSEARSNRNRNALRSALTGSKIDLIDLRGEPLELRRRRLGAARQRRDLLAPGDEIADVIYHFRQSTPEADGGGT